MSSPTKFGLEPVGSPREDRVRVKVEARDEDLAGGKGLPADQDVEGARPVDLAAADDAMEKRHWDRTAAQ